MQELFRKSDRNAGHRIKFLAAVPIAATSLALGLVLTGCTAATPDLPVAGTGGSGQTTGSGGTTTAASGGSGAPGSGGSTVGSGGSNGTGGSPGPGSGGFPGSGGNSAGTGGSGTGSGGQSSTGSGGQATGSGGQGTGSGGAVGTGGATASKGCWNTADGKYVAGATLNQDGKIVLFDGSNMNEWRKEGTTMPSHWALTADKTMEVVPAEPPTDLQSVKMFEDLCVHVEYMTPMVTSADTGQNRGNSGVYLKSAYEMQILDSVGFPIDINTCGAVYGIRAPDVSACYKQLIWNTYEIEFKGSRWTGTTKTANASYVLVTLNGMVVQRDVPLDPPGGFTQAGNPDRPGPQPLMLQDHRWRVQFRNIWAKVPQY